MIFVGVDIGSCALKAVAVKKTKKGFAILQTHFFPIEEETDSSAQTISHLKMLKSLYTERDTRYIFCLSQNEISVELLQFPFKERYKILKSLPYQLEDKLSLFDYKNLISDIKMAGFLRGKKEVLVFSGFKKNIADLLNLAQSAEITPFILTCSAVSIANLFELKQDLTPSFSITEHTNKEEKSAKQITADIYLKIGHTHTTALIFAQNQLKNVYSFEWGVVDCIRKIALKYEIPFQKAFEQFCEKAFVITHTKGYTGSQMAFSKAIQDGFSHLIDKVRLLLLQLEGENTYKCQKILICGGGAQVRNLQALFSFHLQLPVERVSAPTCLPSWDLRSNNNKQNNLITALGTALEGFKKLKNPAVNFLKEEFAPTLNPFSFVFNEWRKPLLLGGTALVLLSFYATIRNYQAEKLSHKIHTVFQKQSARIMKVDRKKINIERVKRFIKSKKVQEQETQITEVLSKTPSVLDTMKRLSSVIKKKESWELDIQLLNIQGPQIEIQGTVNRQNMPELKKNLMDIAVKGSLKSLALTVPIKEELAKGEPAKSEQAKEELVKGQPAKLKKDKTTKEEKTLAGKGKESALTEPFKYSFTQRD